jgi:hypothetical protein
MATKRARISDRNPLTATDGVIAGYEQVNKSASQTSEVKEQPGNQATSEQVNKLASQLFDKTTSQQVSMSTIQNELVERDNSSDNPATEEVSKPASQLVEDPILTSQEPDNPTSQEVNKLELASDRASAPQGGRSELGKSTSQQSEKLASQQVSKPIIRKATFQVDASILADLDRYHLQLQIEMGRRNAPYKEILVEEAIAQWLERAAKSPDRAVKSLLKRQEQR